MPGRSRSSTATMHPVIHTKEVAPSKPAARFDRQPVTSMSRPINTEEHHAIYDFECHAQRCSHCAAPYEVYRKGQQLCQRGHKYAQNVASHLYNESGATFSRSDEEKQPVLVELPTGYRETAGLLKAIERSLRSTSRREPFVSQDRSYYVAERRPTRRNSIKVDHRPRSGEIVDWASEDRDPKPVRRSATVNVNTNSKHGSLYEADVAQQKADSRKYNVEVREPPRGLSGYGYHH